MALPESAPIAFSEVIDEFGTIYGPVNLASYLKGQGYVGSKDHAPSVPSSLPLKLSDFYGAYKVTYWAEMSPTTLAGMGSGEGVELVTSETGTVTVTGGTAPFTYTYSKVSGTNIAYSKSGNTVYFYGNLGIDGLVGATYRCTVQDSTSAVCTVDFNVSLSNPAPE